MPRKKPHRRPVVNREAQLEAIYADIPEIECRGLCHQACGPTRSSRLEKDLQLGDYGRSVPDGTFSSGPCPELTVFKQCAVYPRRPAICRLWGVSTAMRCSHGCRPARYLTTAETDEILARVAELDGDRSTADRMRSRPK